MSHSSLAAHDAPRLLHEPQPSQRPPVCVAIRQTSSDGQPLELPGGEQGWPAASARSSSGSSPASTAASASPAASAPTGASRCASIAESVAASLVVASAESAPASPASTALPSSPDVASG